MHMYGNKQPVTADADGQDAGVVVSLLITGTAHEIDRLVTQLIDATCYMAHEPTEQLRELQTALMAINRDGRLDP